MKARICSTRTSVALLLASLLALAACAPARPPVATITVCPPIPVPARPAAPSVVLPAPDSQGRYCLTQRQVNDLASGIRELQGYADQLTAAVKVYNDAQHQPARAHPGK